MQFEIKTTTTTTKMHHRGTSKMDFSLGPDPYSDIIISLTIYLAGIY